MYTVHCHLIKATKHVVSNTVTITLLLLTACSTLRHVSVVYMYTYIYTTRMHTFPPTRPRCCSTQQITNKKGNTPHIHTAWLVRYMLRGVYMCTDISPEKRM